MRRLVPNQQRPLLDIAHLEVYPNERIGLMGASGSGKSTLLRAIAGLDPCQSGEVRFQGNVVKGETMTAYRRQVMFLPQRSALAATTVGENFRLPFQWKVARDLYDEQVVLSLLDRFGRSAAFLDQPAEAISGGEAQMVALIRAIQLRPRVLLLDEPTASLDTEAVRTFESVLIGWQQEASGSTAGRALVMVSHDAEQVQRISTRTLRLDQGTFGEGQND